MGSASSLTQCPLSDVAGGAAETRDRKIRHLRRGQHTAELNKSRVNGRACLTILKSGLKMLL